MAKYKKEFVKRAVIAGAAEALRLRNESPTKPEREILREVIEKAGRIIKEVDKD